MKIAYIIYTLAKPIRGITWENLLSAVCTQQRHRSSLYIGEVWSESSLFSYSNIRFLAIQRFNPYINITGEVKNNKLRIGNTEVDVYNPENRTKVPDVLFYENTQVFIQAAVWENTFWHPAKTQISLHIQ